MKKSGLIVLLLAALLVAMPVAADAPRAFNEMDVSMLGTKINVQEEVGGTAAENAAALAAEPAEALADALILFVLTGIVCAIHVIRVRARIDGRYQVPEAGGQRLRFRLT
jgi:hypothetical protein